MNLLPATMAIAVAGIASAALVLGLVCFVVGVLRGDRAELGLAPTGPCSRFARRVAGLHVVSSACSLTAEENHNKKSLQITN